MLCLRKMGAAVYRFYALNLGFIFLLNGCASIVNGQNQTLSVTTPGCPGASCELSNDKGKWFISSTPGSVTVNRGYADLFVKCSKGDSPPIVQSVPSKTKSMAFGNILFGGIIGAGVDVANGSAYDYPPEISLPSICAPLPPNPSPPVSLGCTVKELTDVKDRVSGLPITAQGVLVTAVRAGSLAEISGVHPGDVLLEFNGKTITGIPMLAESLSKQSPRQSIHIRYFRDGRYSSAEIKPKGDNL